MSVISVNVSDILFDDIQIYDSQKDIENYDMQCEGKKVQMNEGYILKSYVITAFYYNTDKVISLRVFNSFLLKGTQGNHFTKEDLQLEAELVYLSIGQTRAIFYEQCKKLGYNDIILPHQSLKDVQDNLQNGIYSTQN